MQTQPSRILIVDDEPAVRMTLELALADTPHSVVSVDSAEQALAELALVPVDLLIVDKNLPGMNGGELIRKVHQIHEEVWAAMITGYPSADSAMEMLHLGVRGYLEKPFDDIYAVVRKIDQLLELKRGGERMKSITARLKDTAHLVPTTRALKIVVAAADAQDRAWLMQHTGTGIDSVLTVPGFREALGVIRHQAPDLLVADGMVRDLDLFAFLHSARSENPELLVAVLSDTPSLRMIARPLSPSHYRARIDGLLMRLRSAPAHLEPQPSHRPPF